MKHFLALLEWFARHGGTETYFSKALHGAYLRGVHDAFAGTIVNPSEEAWCSLFEPGEQVPLKAIVFEVRAIHAEGMLLAPVGVTKRGREIANRNRREKLRIVGIDEAGDAA